jgi:hypothetical protein
MMMAQQPDDDAIQQFMRMAAPKDDPTGMGLPVSEPTQMAPVDPHASLTAPIGPAPPEPMPMAAGPSSAAQSSPKMSLLKPQEDRMSAKLADDYHKDADPYGSPDNHPGFFGKLLHGLNAIETGALHGTGQLTSRETEENQLQKSLQDLSKQESTEGLQGSETAKNTEETGEMPQKATDTHALSGATTANLESEQKDRDAAAANPSLIVGHAHAVNKALSENRDPATDSTVLAYEKALQSTVPGFNKPVEAPKTTDIKGPDGKVHTMGFDAKTGKYDTDEGESGFKPAVTNVNAGLSALDRETSRFAKPYEKGVADANTQLEKIADARSMVNGNAESQALGMPKVLTALVSGAGSGVRITQPELNSIAKARGLAGDVEGTLNSWAGKGKLTSTQQQQLTQILDDVKARIEAKQAIHSNALDTINSAPTREAAIQADKDARQKITDLEKNGPQPPRPANVPEGYVLRDGPKGRGYYKP